IGDFDNNQRNDMLLLKGPLRPSQAVQFARPDQNAWGVEAMMINRSRSFSFKTTGTLKVRLDWNRTFQNFSNVDIGAAGVNPANELDFTLDPTNPDVIGIRSRGASVPFAEFYVGFSPDDP